MKLRVRRVLVLLLAAVVPFGAIVFVTSAASRYRASRPAAPKAGDRLTDYVNASTQEGRALAAGAEVWRGGTDDRSYRDIEAVDGRILVVNHDRFVVIDRSGSELHATAFSGVNGRMAGASAISIGPSPREFWIYSSPTGYFGQYTLDTPVAPTRIAILDRSSGVPYWIGRQIVLAGAFEEEQLRVLQEVEPAASPAANSGDETALPASRTERVATVGRALVPGLSPTFARFLHDGVVALKPSRDRLVVAMQWHPRLHIYKAGDHPELERAIASPTITQLEVATVGKERGEAAPTIADGTTYAYTDVAATDNAIIALYSGRERRKFGGAFNLGDTLHVYSWDGRLIGVWVMKDAVKALTIDVETRTLFGLKSSPAPSIVKIDATDLFARVADFVGARPVRHAF